MDERRGSGHSDYTSLHKAMKNRGFVRWVRGKDGDKNCLPTAEYNMQDTALSRSEVLDRAKDAANSVKPKPKPWILVTESAGRAWSGLKPWEE